MKISAIILCIFELHILKFANLAFLLPRYHLLQSKSLPERPPVLISELNSAPATMNKWCQFIELKYADECQFKRDSSAKFGPSLDGYYLLIIQGYNKIYRAPVVKVFINMTGYHFRKNQTTFVIGDSRGLGQIANLKLDLHSEAVVKPFDKLFFLFCSLHTLFTYSMA